ncbi:hypothetical protein ACFFX0_23665 [Citricoccus parietis]|uniref:Uncharacterized protein n=1 Tax=Citricoccus parietis TaxID=592307 RepID=A0ABV5G505_9MICC
MHPVQLAVRGLVHRRVELREGRHVIGEAVVRHRQPAGQRGHLRQHHDVQVEEHEQRRADQRDDEHAGAALLLPRGPQVLLHLAHGHRGVPDGYDVGRTLVLPLRLALGAGLGPGRVAGGALPLVLLLRHGEPPASIIPVVRDVRGQSRPPSGGTVSSPAPRPFPCSRKVSSPPTHPTRV